MPEGNKRLDYIDRAKGILIVLMIAGHIWQHGYQYSLIYVFHMPAFFVISGYLLSLSKSYERGYGRFAAKKAYAFLLPYLFMDSLGIVHDIIRNGVLQNWKGYVYNIISLHTNDGDVWFLRTLLVIELLFPFFLYVLKKRPIMLLASVVMWAVSLFIISENIYIVILRRILTYFLPFTVGFCWGRAFSVRKLWALLVSLVFVPLSAFVNWRSIPLPFQMAQLLRMIASFGGTYLIIQLSMFFVKPISSFLEHFGKNSIIVYCTHHVLYAAIGILIGYSDFKTITFLPGLIILLAVVILEIPIIYCINRWLPFLAGRHYRDRHRFLRMPEKQKL